jgi:hypothetical protein
MVGDYPSFFRTEDKKEEKVEQVVPIYPAMKGDCFGSITPKVSHITLMIS